MPSLLDLPREIVQEIISLTLQPPFCVSKTPKDVNPDDWVASGSPRRSRRNRAKDPYSIIEYYKWKPLYSISMTCWQLKMDAEDVWNRDGGKVGCEVVSHT